MLYFRLHSLLRVLVFLSSHLALASRFRFGIQEIYVGLPRDLEEDDLVLAIVSTAGSDSSNQTWLIGAVETNTTISWSNLTHEFDVPANPPNVSVSIGAANDPDADEESIEEFVSGVADLASLLPGIGGFFGSLVGFLTDLSNCTGPVVADNIVYAPATLDNMTQNQKVCNTKNYTNASPHLLCGTDNSSYTVTYCLERLTSNAVDLVPGIFLAVVSLAVAILL
ncbi:uncharacterized protein N0V89_009258 [Didymosphaeria variabile]|uniref:Uncharacterized protein n=1 Tax=Didymosphaeria variabile TaxID=1932322 RepID=A0A9W8XEQ4_9PLEO|nr:uncharacterized protein N0V89_009258 [Didymosphaeria variabile]KAJ4347886.1 hypothetical protein N0V89_009258 [Didymosphaeria variabile]